MVKKAMKKHQNDPVSVAIVRNSKLKQHKALHRVLNLRQFGLKMIANVTYGYTSASFSGRMPCVDIADSIVQTARDTLERVQSNGTCHPLSIVKAIHLVESTPEWQAKVVYGDTDRLCIQE